MKLFWVFLPFAAAYDSLIERVFDEWSVKFDRNWASKYERAFRFKIWLANHDLIEAHNSHDESYTLGHNAFSDMTSDEFANTFLKPFPVRPMIFNAIRQIKAQYWWNDSRIEPQASVDWRKKGVVGAVRNQGQCGSCWAESAVASLEGAYAQHHPFRALSVQELVSCDDKNSGCKGGLMSNAFLWVNGNGLTAEEEYPYRSGERGHDYRCELGVEDFEEVIAAGSVRHKDVPQHREDLMISAANFNVLSAAVDATKFQFYESGVFNPARCGSQLNHGVNIIGYSTNTTIPYWIVRNSWGSDWGEIGYIDIAMGNNLCGINNEVTFAVVQ